jgi:hypothetical protein
MRMIKEDNKAFVAFFSAFCFATLSWCWYVSFTSNGAFVEPLFWGFRHALSVASLKLLLGILIAHHLADSGGNG